MYNFINIICKEYNKIILDHLKKTVDPEIVNTTLEDNLILTYTDGEPVVMTIDTIKKGIAKYIQDNIYTKLNADITNDNATEYVNKLYIEIQKYIPTNTIFKNNKIRYKNREYTVFFYKEIDNLISNVRNYLEPSRMADDQEKELISILTQTKQKLVDYLNNVVKFDPTTTKVTYEEGVKGGKNKNRKSKRMRKSGAKKSRRKH